MTSDQSLDQVCDRWVQEVLGLRMGAQYPDPDASTGTMLSCLLDLRTRLDRVEEILASALAVRGAAARQHVAVRSQADDAWDAAAVRQRNSAVRDEYSSAKERAAATNLEVLDLRRVERAADGQFRRCDEAVESIRLRLRGLQEVRHDILAIIRIRQFETTLER